ncbi:MAG: energy-coupling factor transporter transmembrane protein EcfT [Clostridia bacterium]|nr:energy-coupling factor transporter transmembrane protein EcfT [Clostridia bacterium]
MLKDITLGQFFPGNSLLHRLDPRTKILCSILLIVAVFLAKSALAYGVLILLTAALIIISQIPAGTVFKALKPLIVIIIITAFFNMFFTGGEEENVLADFRIWFLHPVIRVEGIVSAVKMALRIVLLILQTSVVLTYTTSPIDMTDGIERLLSPLAKIRVPVHTFAMMMSLALRFIPTLIEETDKIISAQKSRGADFSSGNVIRRVKALVPVLIPLLLSSFRRADDLALAMECRCYRGGTGRTRMKIMKMTAKDFLFILFCALFIAVRFLPMISSSALGITGMNFSF